MNLTKPYEGLHFWVWRFLIHMNFAKSGTWGCQTTFGTIRTDLFAVTLVDFNETKAVSVVIGPFKLMVGFA